MPVGVLVVQGEWLQDYEIEESIAAKKRRRRIHKAYERVTIYAASVLKTKVYSGEVTFTIPSALFHLSNRHIREVSIDVADYLYTAFYFK